MKRGYRLMAMVEVLLLCLLLAACGGETAGLADTDTPAIKWKKADLPGEDKEGDGEAFSREIEVEPLGTEEVEVPEGMLLFSPEREKDTLTPLDSFDGTAYARSSTDMLWSSESFFTLVSDYGSPLRRTRDGYTLVAGARGESYRLMGNIREISGWDEDGLYLVRQAQPDSGWQIMGESCELVHYDPVSGETQVVRQEVKSAYTEPGWNGILWLVLDEERDDELWHTVVRFDRNTGEERVLFTEEPYYVNEYEGIENAFDAFFIAADGGYYLEMHYPYPACFPFVRYILLDKNGAVLDDLRYNEESGTVPPLFTVKTGGGVAYTLNWQDRGVEARFGEQAEKLDGLYISLEEYGDAVYAVRADTQPLLEIWRLEGTPEQLPAMRRLFSQWAYPMEEDYGSSVSRMPVVHGPFVFLWGDMPFVQVVNMETMEVYTFNADGQLTCLIAE